MPTQTPVPPQTPPQTTVIAIASARAVDLGGVAPKWVQLFPYGTVMGRDGRGPYTVRDAAHAAEIIAATTAYQAGADAPIDYDHQTQFAAQNGQRALASGWIKTLEARADGIYARTEWTASAAQHIAAREYRYISPTFVHDRDGTVLRIVGAGLTNLPNLDIPAIASQSPSQTQGASMDPADLLKRLAAALGLPETASADDVLALCTSLATDRKTTDSKTAAKATDPAAATATASQAVDLTKFVPMEVHLAVASQLASVQAQVAAGAAEQAVDAAITAGKVTPAMRPWAVAMASQSLTDFAAYVANAPVLVATASQSPASALVPPPALSGKASLSAEQLAVASQLGIAPDTYAKALQETTR